MRKSSVGLMNKRIDNMMQEENFGLKDIISGIFAILFIAACIIFTTLAIRVGMKEMREFNKFVEESIGKEVVIQGDTLTVVSYQDGGWGNVSGFMLNNGVIIDKKLIKSE